MKKSITIPDMMCKNCEKRMEGLATKLSGIISVAATHETHLLEIDFDEKKLSIEQIITEISAMGFHPESGQG